jgi:hypothetical protein
MGILLVDKFRDSLNDITTAKQKTRQQIKAFRYAASTNTAQAVDAPEKEPDRKLACLHRQSSGSISE